ncbi:unnamed protein product [Heligmosomoides polygyrus]|uniref:Ribonuclease H n=1 Tax=Heligmosomoides polygyrus TaxID=6339 RepID=A0A183GMF5_HELPZ|nr:unnamed protein product [Heligmosomoides polygyrus]
MKKKQIDVLFTGVNDKESKGDVVGPVVAVDKDSVPTATIVPKKLQQLWVDAPEDRDWIRKLFMREDRYMETAEDEPRVRWSEAEFIPFSRRIGHFSRQIGHSSKLVYEL